MSKKKHNSIFDADAQTRRSIWRYPSHTTSMTRIKCLVATLCVLASFTSTAQEIQPLPGQGEVAQIGRFKHFKSTMLEGTWTGSLVMRQPNIPANKCRWIRFNCVFLCSSQKCVTPRVGFGLNIVFCVPAVGRNHV